MEKKYLNITKHRLTIVFTLLVFILSALLGTIFLFSKYSSEKSKDIADFIARTHILSNKNINLEKFVSSFRLINKITEKSLESRGMLLGDDETRQLINFLVIDKEGIIKFQNINNNIEGRVLKSVFDNIDYNKIYRINGFFLKTAEISDKYGVKYDVIAFKKQNYSSQVLSVDLTRFFILITLFSVVFYVIGLWFVKKNLKPVEESIQDMQNFIHNAGHEFKTPISIIRGNLQLIDTLKKYDKSLIMEGIKEIDRLAHLIDGLVELSDLKKQNNDEIYIINDEILQIINELSNKADEKGIEMTFKNQEKISLLINKDYLYILFSNILSNAIKYTKRGGKIQVIIKNNSITVKDNGMGIESNNLEKIFDRFFQGGDSRMSDGFGIGLSLVRKIADIYNWKIEVKSKKGKGSSFIIKF